MASYSQQQAHKAGRSGFILVGESCGRSLRMHAARRTFVCAAFLTLLAGCGDVGGSVNSHFIDHGLAIVVPGIDGANGRSSQIIRGLIDSGLEYAIELYDWTSPLGPLHSQCALTRNRQQAARLAARIALYQQEHPERPVVLIAHSGGTAIAVWAAEVLPAGHKLDRIILLASSLSPQYPLEGALLATRRGIVSFHSERDNVWLGLGTWLFGTMDRRYTHAAGMTGFRIPEEQRQASHYRKLSQVAYRPVMANSGHDGGHFSVAASEFVAAYVAPLAAAGRLDRESLAAVASGQELLAAGAPAFGSE